MIPFMLMQRMKQNCIFLQRNKNVMNFLLHNTSYTFISFCKRWHWEKYLQRHTLWQFCLQSCRWKSKEGAFEAVRQNLSAACRHQAAEKNNQSLSPSTGFTETLHTVAYLGVLKINQNMTKVGLGTFSINGRHLKMDGARRFADVRGKLELF